MAGYYPEQTIVTGGMSKAFNAGGWRLGVALLPEALGGNFKETVLGIASETYSCVCLPIQMAACKAYEPTKEMINYIQHQRRILSTLGMESCRRLQRSGIRIHEPQGAFYLFLDFSNLLKPEIETSQSLCQKLLADTGVALLPGAALGMNSEYLSAGLAYVDFDGAAAMNASMRLGLSTPMSAIHLAENFSKTLEGIDKLCEWTMQHSPNAPEPLTIA